MSSVVDNSITTELSNTVPISADNEVQATAPVKNPSHSFIDKHIHPPSAVPGYAGMPTNDSRTQVITNWVELNTIRNVKGPAPAGQAPVDAAPNYVDGFAFLHTSGIRHPNIAFFHYNQSGDVADGWHQDVANTIRLSIYDTNRFRYDANKFRPAYRSNTITLNATAFNDVGMLSSCQFNGSLLFSGTILQLTEKYPKRAKAFLTAHCSAHKIAGIKKDHLELFPPNIQSHLRDVLHVQDGATILVGGRAANLRTEVPEQLNLDPNTSIQFIDFNKQGNGESGNQLGAVVPTHSQVINMSTRSYGGPAKEGNFITQRINTVAPRWMAAANDDAANLPNLGMYECYVAYEDLNGVDQFYPFTEIGVDGKCRPLIDVQWSDDMTWGWTLITGLVPNTNISTGLVSDNLLIVKTYIGTEIQPAAQSAWAGMQALGPRPDMTAMQALMEAYYDLKDGMPAKYNFAGLANVARLAASKIAPHAIKFVTNKLQGNTRSRGGKTSNMSLNERFSRMTTQPRARSSSRNRSSSRGRSNSRRRSSSRRPPTFTPRARGPPKRGKSRNHRRSNRDSSRIGDIERKVTDIDRKVEARLIDI